MRRICIIHKLRPRYLEACTFEIALLFCRLYHFTLIRERQRPNPVPPYSENIPESLVLQMRGSTHKSFESSARYAMFTIAAKSSPKTRSGSITNNSIECRILGVIIEVNKCIVICSDGVAISKKITSSRIDSELNSGV